MILFKITMKFIPFQTYLYYVIATTFQFTVFLINGELFSDSIVEVNEYRPIASCIGQITKRELWRPTLVLNIKSNPSRNELDFDNNMVMEFSENIVLHTIVSNTESDTFASNSGYIFVYYYEDCEAMTKFNFHKLNINTKHLIILNKYSDVCTKRFVGIENVIGKYDISFFIKHSEDQYNLYTYIPYIDPESCKVVIKKAHQINTCYKGKLRNFDAFPPKRSTNLNNCPFKVGLGPLYPFAIFKNSTSLRSYDQLNLDQVKGMDVHMVRIMAEYFNATLQLHYIHKEEENPYVNMEFVSLLLNGSLEVCAGGLYRIYGNVVDYSGTYASQSVIWIYSAERTSKTWNSMIASIDGLYLFIIFYLTYSVVWYLIRIFDKHAVSFKSTLVYAWGALVGTTSLQDAKSLKQMVLNVVYLNMCLHLSVYISIQLYSYLTIQGPPEILKTNADIMNSGRIPFLKTFTKYFVKDEKYERFANTSVECSGFADCAQVSLVKKGVTVFIQGHFYPFQAGTSMNDEARMLRPVENLLTVYYEMLIRKDSTLILKFQRLVQRLFEAGITEKLYKDAIGLTVVEKANSAAKNMITSSYACQSGCKISLKQVSGIFYVWGVGCLLSFCIFLFEIISKRDKILII